MYGGGRKNWGNKRVWGDVIRGLLEGGWKGWGVNGKEGMVGEGGWVYEGRGEKKGGGGVIKG